jgi:hypothetical protein
VAVERVEHSTVNGRIYELYGHTNEVDVDLWAEFSTFSAFLDLCISDPARAEQRLLDLGVASPDHVESLVVDYGREARRLNRALRHERETRVLAIRHQLEADLDSLGDGAQSLDQVERIVDALVPREPGLARRGREPTRRPV